jgi:hypothetical protein
MVNGTLMLYHSVPALGQTPQAELEKELIDAAIAYLAR